MTLEFHPEATQELDDAAEWYLGRSTKAAQEFAFSIRNAMSEIQNQPARFAMIHGGLRTYRMLRFPFQIIFRIDLKSIFIVAIAHAKRKPGYWHERV